MLLQESIIVCENSSRSYKNYFRNTFGNAFKAPRVLSEDLQIFFQIKFLEFSQISSFFHKFISSSFSSSSKFHRNLFHIILRIFFIQIFVHRTIVEVPSIFFRSISWRSPSESSSGLVNSSRSCSEISFVSFWECCQKFFQEVFQVYP